MRQSAEQKHPPVDEADDDLPTNQRMLRRRAKDPLVGKTIDERYLIEGVLGEGGMGIVYAAKHTVLGKRLAVKVLRQDVSGDDEIMTRFRQEAQSASAIGNQHIIDVSDFGTLPDGATYFVMEHLDGYDLTTVIEDQSPVPASRVVYIAKQLCRALGAAHDNGIVHRDMKPDNVYLVTRGGERDFAKILDFGIAKVGGSTSKLTKAGQVFGTPHYMSPEQCAGRGVDHRTDIYALGCILYEMVTGACPFDAENLMGILTKHLYEDPVPPTKQDPPADIPKSLELVIMKCLVKDKDDRYQTMTEVYDDLCRVESGVMPDVVLSGVSLAKSSASKWALGSIALVLVAVVSAVMILSGPSEAETDALPPVGQEPVVADPQVAEDQGQTEIAEGETLPDSPPAPVLVTIHSDPAGAEVWRGGELIGNTPVEIPKPAEGESYEFELRHEGYLPWPVRVSSLTQSQVTVQLRADRGGSRDSRRDPRRAEPGAAAGRDVNPRWVRDREPAPRPQAVQPAPAPQPARAQPRSRTHLPGTGEVLDPWATP